MFDCAFHQSVCYLIPTIIIIEHRCDDSRCHSLHAIEIDLSWLWATVSLTISFGNTEVEP